MLSSCLPFAKDDKDHLLTLTHREFKLVVFISGHERPPAFDSLLLKDGHHRHLCLICHHLDGALFGGLSATWETVKVELDCTLVEKQKIDKSNCSGGWTWLILWDNMCAAPRKSSAEK